MLFVIIWQRKRSLGEIIYKLTEDGAQNLHLGELIMFITFIVFALFTAILTIILALTKESSFSFRLDVLRLKNWFLVALLIFVFLPYAYFFRKYHYHVYS